MSDAAVVIEVAARSIGGLCSQVIRLDCDDAPGVERSLEEVILRQACDLPLGDMRLVDDACGERRAVIVVAACFSGVFVPPLSGRNRMVLTAARPDRASFGCGEEDRYTFFDTCMLQQLPLAKNFAVLGPAVQACVAKREQDLGAEPPSEPQLWIGPAIGPDLPLLAFSASP